MINYVGIKTVIAKILRDTRTHDSSFIEDFKEWIPEAMGMLQTSYVLETRAVDVKIDYHKGKLPPCTIVEVDAVVGPSGRMYKSGVIAQPQMEEIRQSRGENFVSIVHPLSPDVPNVFNSTIVSMDSYCSAVFGGPTDVGNWYKIENLIITTSFKQGVVRIFYRTIPSDEEGFPLVPDHPDYIEAIYWYCRSKMIGAGYIDRSQTEDSCREKFEVLGRRAINSITYPTPDDRENAFRVNTSLVFNDNYWLNMNGTSIEGNYDNF